VEKIKASGIIQNINLAEIGVMTNTLLNETCIARMHNTESICQMSVPDRPGIASAVLTALGERGINVQFIVQSIDLKNHTHMILCVAEDDLEAALSAIEGVKSKVRADDKWSRRERGRATPTCLMLVISKPWRDHLSEKVIFRPNVAIVSVFGPHFRDYPGIAGVAFSALASVGINILAISTSISTISCLIDGDRAAEAVGALREAFDVPSSAVFTASRGLSLRSRAREGGG